MTRVSLIPALFLLLSLSSLSLSSSPSSSYVPRRTAERSFNEGIVNKIIPNTTVISLPSLSFPPPPAVAPTSINSSSPVSQPTTTFSPIILSSNSSVILPETFSPLVSTGAFVASTVSNVSLTSNSTKELPNLTTIVSPSQIATSLSEVPSSSISSYGQSYWNSYVNFLKSLASLDIVKQSLKTLTSMSLNTLIKMNLLSLTALAGAAFVSFMMSPQAAEMASRIASYELPAIVDTTVVEMMARNVELAIDSYDKLDPAVCLRMAACTLQKERAKKRSQETASSNSVTDHVSSSGNNNVASEIDSSSNKDNTDATTSNESVKQEENATSGTRDPFNSHPIFTAIQLLDKILM